MRWLMVLLPCYVFAGQSSTALLLQYDTERADDWAYSLQQNLQFGGHLAVSAELFYDPEAEAPGSRLAVKRTYLISPFTWIEPDIALDIDWNAPRAQVFSGFGAGYRWHPRWAVLARTAWSPKEGHWQVLAGIRYYWSHSDFDGELSSSYTQAGYWRTAHQAASLVQNSMTDSKNSQLTREVQAENPPSVRNPIVADDADVRDSTTALDAKPPQEPLQPGFYVHLGLFEHVESAQQLSRDLRLRTYRDQIFHWYDEQRQAYRLLLGPTAQLDSALKIKNQLDMNGLESFIYSKTSPSNN